MSETTDTVELIGSVEENFYLLGTRAKSDFSDFKEKLLRTRTSLPLSMSLLKETWAKLKINKSPSSALFNQAIKAFCDGLGLSVLEYLYYLELLEVGVLSFESKREFALYHSEGRSVVLKDHQDEDITLIRLHGSPLILQNVPLQILHLRFQGHAQVRALIHPFFPMCFDICQNEYGMALSLHPRKSQTSAPNGQSIYEFVFDNILELKTLPDAKKSIKNMVPQKPWGILVADSLGGTLMAEIGNESLYQENFHLDDYPLVSMDHRPLLSFKTSDLQTKDQDLLKFYQKNKKVKDVVTALANGPKKSGPLSQLIYKMDLKHFNCEMIPLTPNLSESFFLEAQEAFDTSDLEKAFFKIQMGMAQAPESDAVLVWLFWQYQYMGNNKDHKILYNQLLKLKKNLRGLAREHADILQFLLEEDLKLAHAVSLDDVAEDSWREKLKDYTTSPWPKRYQFRLHLDARLVPRILDFLGH